MLNWTINLAFLLTIIYYGLGSIKTGVLIYCVGTFLVPVFQIGGIELSFDVWCFPILAAVYYVKNKNLVFKGYCVKLMPYVLVYTVLSLIMAIRFDCGIPVETIYATVRFIVMIQIIVDSWKGEMISFADKTFGVVVCVNAICSIVQMTNIVSVEAFYDMYYKASMTPLLTQLQIGYFNRAYGTTGSPVILGGIAALAYAFYFSMFVSGRSKIKMNAIKIGASVVCGVLALSKTAMLAIPIISVYILFLSAVTGEILKNKRLFKIMLLIAIGGAGLIFVFYWMQKKDFAIAWYLRYLTDPFAALETRYDSDSGILSETMDVICEHFLFGVGHAEFAGAFVGDSSYMVLLYRTGIIGLFLYLFPFGIVLLKATERADIVKSSLIVTFLLIAVGNSMYLSYWFIPFAAVMFESCPKRKSSCEKSVKSSALITNDGCVV